MLKKVVIRNYRLFEEFELDFDTGMNIIVGDNDSGKSTLIEAVNLALTGRISGRWLFQDFSPFLINRTTTANYVAAVREASPGNPPTPPEVIIDLFLEDASSEAHLLRGTNNLLSEDACGVRIRGALDDDYVEEYKAFASNPDQVRLVPTEYYKVDWLGFSGNAVTMRSIPASTSVIDPGAMRLRTGTDIHLQQIIRTHLEPRERVELSREYRSLREEFSERKAVKAVNERLAGNPGTITDRDFSLSVDLSQRYTWEHSLAAHLDELPFQFVGKGEQNSVKTLLAIGRRAKGAHVVLIEEPENHLSFSSLRSLLLKIEERCVGQQVIVATHSSFVLNKLGLDRLILLGAGRSTRLTSLAPGTGDYFKKLAGFDTLRLALAKQAILVEGPSDELVVQRAYRDQHDGRLPIEDGIDVISVRGLSFPRYLELAVGLNLPTRVVRDNDGKDPEDVQSMYAAFTGEAKAVSVYVGKDPCLPTLEYQITAVNDLPTLNHVLGRELTSKKDILTYMLNNKTTAALSIFESEVNITMPEYVYEAVT